MGEGGRSWRDGPCCTSATSACGTTKSPSYPQADSSQLVLFLSTAPAGVVHLEGSLARVAGVSGGCAAYGRTCCRSGVSGGWRRSFETSLLKPSRKIGCAADSEAEASENPQVAFIRSINRHGTCRAWTEGNVEGQPVLRVEASITADVKGRIIKRGKRKYPKNADEAMKPGGDEARMRRDRSAARGKGQRRTNAILLRS